MKTSEKRTTSLQGTTGPSPMCPLFGGFTVISFRRFPVFEYGNHTPGEQRMAIQTS